MFSSFDLYTSLPKVLRYRYKSIDNRFLLKSFVVSNKYDNFACIEIS